ncbi:M91 family zinc metallopeptidase [Pseudomonas carnis]|uniref:M91 family zinc metallopeptidase n=1 Tax=Pseudomonas carnis TaxID=2487355 RepID=UPI001E63779C|nr:M91 family zinc metallopeptidase [Pseudomonas carnis]
MNTSSLSGAYAVNPQPMAPVEAPSSTTSPRPPIQINAKSAGYVGPDRTVDFLYFSSHSRLTPDQDPLDTTQKKYINTDVLRHDANVKIYQEITYLSKNGEPIGAAGNECVIETTDRADKVIIKKGPDDSLVATINNIPYQLSLARSSDGTEIQPLRIKTKGGDDCVVIHPDVNNDIRIELGEGNDYARAGSGNTRLYGGAGNDWLKLGSGVGIAFGDDGDDLLIAGSGSGILKGNNGNDRMQSGEGSADRHIYMDGGDGHDFMISTSNDSPNPIVMHGGKGENLIVTQGPATIYTGRDKNIVRSNSDDTVIYAKPSDEIHRTPGSTLIHTQYREAGKSGYVVEGSPEFIQYVEDDMELLRMSLPGKKMLSTADNSAQRNDSPVRITETADDNGFYIFNNAAVRNHLATGKSLETLEPAAQGYIAHNQRGAFATGAQLQYNPSFVPNDETAPVNVLFHEMAHAYNGATGTFLEGQTVIDENPEGEPNDERQAIGLPTDALSFDFDDHRATEPTTSNPPAFTENALKEEMRRPLRTEYI